MSDRVWIKFESTVKLCVADIDVAVLKKLRETFKSLEETYTRSDEFRELMKTTLDKISANKQRVYPHLLTFKQAMKAARKSAKKRAGQGVEQQQDEQQQILDAVDKICKAESSTTPVSDDRMTKYICKLEEILKVTQDEIERREADELTLDDLLDENSSFIVLDKLKRHCTKIYRKICRLRKERCNLRHRYTRVYSFNGTSFAGLNKMVEQLVKQKKFPDFQDVRMLVADYSKESGHKWSVQRVTDVATDVFTQVGTHLKKLRIVEFEKNFGNCLTDRVRSADDPILNDADLRRDLNRNLIVGRGRLDQVLDKFTKMQYQQMVGENNDEDVSDIPTEASIDSEGDIPVDDAGGRTELIDELSEGLIGVADNNRLDAEMGSDGDGCVNNVVDKPMTIQQDVLVDGGQKDVIEANVQTNAVVDERHINTPVNNEQTTAPVKVDDARNEIMARRPTISMIGKIPERSLEEIGMHTFTFNVDQLRRGEAGKYFNNVISVDDDDDVTNNNKHDVDSDDKSICSSTDSSSSNDSHSFAYSSKLDEVYKPNPPPQDIFITLDDSDEDVEIVAM